MKFILLGGLLAAGAIATPTPRLKTFTTPEGLTIHGTGHQGDGVYLAVFDANGTGTVEFTPANEHWAEIAATGGSTNDLATSALTKRASGTITCSGRQGNSANMDTANIQLANNAQASGYYGFHAWRWVRSNLMAL